MSIYTQITPQWLKDTFLLGIDLTLDDGSPYPDVAYTQSIQAAIKHVESDLGIFIEPFGVVHEGHDAERQGRYSYYPFRLDSRPVMRVDGLRIRFGAFQPVEVPISWVRFTSHLHGQVNLIPSQESLGSYFFRAGVPLIGGYGIYEDREYIPSYFEFSYTAGFDSREGSATFAAGESAVSVPLDPPLLGSYLVDTDSTVVRVSSRAQDGFTLTRTGDVSEASTVSWSADTLPADLRQAIGIKCATLLLLHVAGDLILGAGIASQSLSVDGLSQSVGTTSSAMYSGYSSRAEALDKQYTLLIKALRAQYKITQFGVV